MQYILTEEEFDALGPKETIESQEEALLLACTMFAVEKFGFCTHNGTMEYCDFCPFSRISKNPICPSGRQYFSK